MPAAGRTATGMLDRVVGHAADVHHRIARLKVEQLGLTRADYRRLVFLLSLKRCDPIGGGENRIQRLALEILLEQTFAAVEIEVGPSNFPVHF
jgi:hypothetical protein